ncbi:hypothetical protein PIB30_021716 [Stylosanthes scabra]|uniref:Uncharacterized protein n=1 Tax=Stylosanthes scabra TaxID=79078 RepID=A0ABU6S903_9FABA|nr:hypothetical protein [Stylosanthes scabra]
MAIQQNLRSLGSSTDSQTLTYTLTPLVLQDMQRKTRTSEKARYTDTITEASPTFQALNLYLKSLTNIRSENPQPMDFQYGKSAKPTVFILVGLLEAFLYLSFSLIVQLLLRPNARLYQLFILASRYGELTRSVIIANPTDPELALDNHRSLVAGTLAEGPPATTVSRDVSSCPTWKQEPHRHLLLPMNRFKRGRIDSEGILNVKFENRVKTNRFGDPSNRLVPRWFMKFLMWSRLEALSNRFKRQVLKFISLCRDTNRFDTSLNQLD